MHVPSGFPDFVPITAKWISESVTPGTSRCALFPLPPLVVVDPEPSSLPELPHAAAMRTTSTTPTDQRRVRRIRNPPCQLTGPSRRGGATVVRSNSRVSGWRVATRGTAMQLEDLILVSVDDHVVEPPTVFDGRLPKKYQELAPKLVTRADGTSAWLYEGQELTNVALNAVAGRPPEEYGFEPT